MLILGSRKSRVQQACVAREVDWSHPLANELAMLLLPTENLEFRDVVNGGVYRPANGSVSRVSTAYGPMSDNSGVNYGLITAPLAGRHMNLASAYSIFYSCIPSAVDQYDGIPIAGISYDNALSNPYYVAAVTVYASGGNRYLNHHFNRGGSYGGVQQFSKPMVTGQYTQMLAGCESGSQLLYVDGAYRAFQGYTGGAPAYGSTAQLCLGTFTLWGPSYGLAAKVYSQAFALWNRKVTENEAKRLWDYGIVDMLRGRRNFILPALDNTTAITGTDGIASGETFGGGGTITVEQTATGSSGIITAEAFGSGGAITGPITGTAGIASGEAMGSDGSVAYTQDVTGSSGIITAEVFGSGGTLLLAVVGSTGIESLEAFGAGIVAGPITGTAGIASGEVVDPTGAIVAALIYGTAGIVTEEAFGTVTGIVSGPIAGAAGIATAEAFGAGGLVVGPIIGTAGITTAEAFGTPGTVSGPVAGAAGIASAETFGAGGLVAALIYGTAGITTAEAFGSGGSLSWGVAGYQGIGTEETFGRAGMVTHGETLALYIRGKKRAMRANTLNVQGDLNGRYVASFELVEYDGIRPNPGDEVIYTSNGVRRFAGFVQTYKESFFHARDVMVLKVTCVDYKRVAEERTFGRVYSTAPFSSRAIVRDIFNAVLQPEGFTWDYDDAEDIVLTEGDRIAFEDETVATCLDRLAGIFGFDWFINFDRVFKYERNRFSLAPFNLRDNDGRWRDMEVERSDEQYRNRQGARTSVPTSGQRVSTIAGNGSHSYYLGWPITDLPKVTVNTTQKTVINYADRASSGPWVFAFETNSNLLRHNPTLTAYTSSDAIVITAPSATIDVYFGEDNPEIARQAARSGGTGIREAVTKATNIRDKAVAASFTQSMLDRLGRITEVVTLETDTEGWYVGQMCSVITTRPRVSNWFVVQSVTMREVDLSFLRYQLKLSGKELPLIQGLTVAPTGGGNWEIGVQLDRGVDGFNIGDPFELAGINGTGNRIDIGTPPGLNGAFVIETIESGTNTIGFTHNFGIHGPFQAGGIAIRGVVVGGVAPYSLRDWKIKVYLDEPTSFEDRQTCTINGVTDSDSDVDADMNANNWRALGYSSVMTLRFNDSGNPKDFSGWDYASFHLNGGSIHNNRTGVDVAPLFIRNADPSTAGRNEFMIFIAEDGDYIKGDSITITSVGGNADTLQINDTWTLAGPDTTTILHLATREGDGPPVKFDTWLWDGGGYVYPAYQGGGGGGEASGGGSEFTANPFGGYVGPSNPGLPTNNTESIPAQGNPQVVVGVDLNTAEVTTEAAHGLNDDTVVMIYGVSGCDGDGSLASRSGSINTGLTRVSVTSPTTFIALDVAIAGLGGAPGFVDDKHGRVIPRGNVQRPTQGVSTANILNTLAGAASGSGSNLNTDTATFILSNSIPGISSRPLQVVSGATNPWVQQADIQVVTDVSAILGTPATGRDVIVDVLRNGVSLFASGGITIPAGSTELVRSTDLAEVPTTIVKSDILTVNVTQVGSDFAGCDATIQVNLRG